MTGWLYRHPRLQLGGLLLLPGAWFTLVYFGSLALLLIAALWHVTNGHLIRTIGLDNFVTLVNQPVYRTIVQRTLTTAVIVTIVDALIAFPIAYYMARVASVRKRRLIYMAVLMPLWASYLVKIYAWRLILFPNGVLDGAMTSIGLPDVAKVFGISDLSITVTFIYLWLPYMILPIHAGLERIPTSLLEASGDLGGRGFVTFRRIVLPLVLPSLVAGSIFTFALTLGDYINPQVTGNSQFIGTVIQNNVGVAANLPFAAALATVPILIIAAYLLIARRLGAFDAL
ncbi:MAG TPA: ABC transporter permease [Candidatus Acidoferrum sp.]|nr:ABC transporter permease [Candidatus Acidoferrum sp.]